MSDLPPPPSGWEPPPEPPRDPSPPPPPGYGPPPTGPGPSRGSNLHVGAAFSYAWSKFGQNAGPLIVVTLVAFLGWIAAFVITETIQVSASGHVATFFVVSSLSQIVLLLVVGFLQLGVYQSALAVTAGYRVEPSRMFSTPYLRSYLIATLLYGVMVGIGTLLFLLPGIVLAFLGFLYPYYVLDQGLEPGAAISASFRTVAGNVVSVLGLAVLALIVYLIGAVACGVGLLVSAPVALIAIAYAYRQLNGEPIAP